MNKLRLFNEKTFSKCMKLADKDELACPNLVSSKKFLDTIKKGPILYLGQETYCWINNKIDKEISIDELEDHYDRFMIDRGASRTIFWQFINSCTGIEYKDLYKSVIWTNTVLMGKRYESGAPNVSKELNDISLEYLLFLYDYFKPQAVISVTGNKNPYYKITNEFLKQIGSKLKNTWPTKNNSLLIDEEKNIFWTYHPVYLNLSDMYKENSQKILSKIKKMI